MNPEKELPCPERQEAATRAARGRGGPLACKTLRRQAARTPFRPPSSCGACRAEAQPVGSLYRPSDRGRAFPGVRGGPPSAPRELR